MFYVLNWFVVVALLALWSLAVWALQAVAVWSVSNAGALSGATSGIGSVALPDWLAPWVPAEIAQSISKLLTGLGPVVDNLLQAAPALAGGVTAVSWVVWGIGTLLLLLLGTGLHLLLALWRRRGGGGSGPNAGRSLAAG